MTNEEIEEQYKKTGWGSPLAVPASVFTLYSFLCFFQCCGFGSAGDTTTSLSFGIIQVILFIGFFTGSLVMIRRGEQMGGQIFMIFAIAFGGVGGVSNICAYCAAQGMFAYDPFMFGVVNLTIGLYLLFMAPTYIHGDIVALLANIMPTIGLLLFGITGMGLCPAGATSALLYAAGVVFLFCGLGGFVTTVNALNDGVSHLPTGPVLFPAKK